jgi:glycosyltransferase 2 family protein
VKNLKGLLFTVAKIAASIAIIGWLSYKLFGTPEGWAAFLEMLRQPKAWRLLAAGVILNQTAVIITIVRWWYLVRALGVDFSLPAAVRIGFLGYFFNFAPTGIAGGDLLKAWMLAREKPGNTAKALASVVVDRIVGLYVLFLVASAGVFLTGFWTIADTTVHRLCLAVLIVTVVSTAGIILVLIPGFLESRLINQFTRIPKIGRAIASLLDAIRIYRSKRLVLFLTSLMTLPVHGLLTVSLFLLALGLRFDDVPMRDYFAVYPISGIAQTVPLPAGPAEAGIVYFYKTAYMRLHEADVETSGAQGLILALVYRLSTVLIVPIGAAYYYFGARREVSEVLHDAEESEGRI